MDKEKPLPTLMENKEESEKIEFKETLKLLDEIGETVSAFSNAGSGIIVVGVSDSGKVMGVHTGKNTLEELASYIKRNTDPQVYPSIKTETVENKRLILIKVPESGDKPVFFKGHAYKRVGKSTLELGSSEIRKLAKDSGGRIYWDNRICEGAKLEDIDEEKVKWFLRKAKHERNFDIEEQTPVKEALERLELAKDDGLTNAAVLLFGANPQKFFLQSKIRCAKYKGTTPIDFIDMKVIEGNLIDQTDDAEKFMLSHIKKAAKIVMFEREEAWEYPPDALREAIVNAVCHRDYESASDVTVGIFDDKIEISDPGKLPEPLTPQDLKRIHKSIPRNPLIANAFFLVKNIEQWGKGTNKMVEWCVEHGLKEPDFTEIAGGFMVTFFAPGDMLSLIPEKGKVDLEKLGLNERQIGALKSMVNKKKTLTIAEYATTFKVNEKTARRDLKRLVELNFAEKVGATKNAYFKAR